MLGSEQVHALIESGRSVKADDPFVVQPPPDMKGLINRTTASIDVHLGRWFLVPRSSRFSSVDLDEHMEPKAAKRIMNRVFVPFNDSYHLHPGNFVLGGTLEWVRMPNNLSGQIVGKSSWGRRGLVVETASTIHPGFTGCLTLEIANLGELPIVLRPGMALGQISLFELAGSSKTGGGRFGGYRRPEMGILEKDDLASRLIQPPKKENQQPA